MMSSPPVRAWPPMPTARSVRTSSSALLSSSFSNANPRGGGQAGARRARRAGRAPSRESGGEGGVGNRKGDDGHGGKPRGRGRDARGRVVAFVRHDLVFSTDKNRLAVRETACAKNASFPREPRKQFSAAALRARLTEARTRGESRPSRGARIARGRSLRTSRRGSCPCGLGARATAPSGSRSETRRRSARRNRATVLKRSPSMTTW